MTMTSENSLNEWEGQNSTLSEPLIPEEQTHHLEKLEPGIVAVFNGKVLDISEELIMEGLSGISVKHYDGNCLSPDEVSDGFLFGEDFPDFEYEEKVPSKTMSSMIRLCYRPRKEESPMSENSPEDMSDYSGKPLCLQKEMNFRNSFWDLHRPELCKLTWPHVYVGEATVTEHLHRHIRNHGAICSEFHEPSDMIAVLDKELDLYDKLKTIQSPREMPSDEEEFVSRSKGGSRKPRKMKFDPCKPTFKPNPISRDNDDDLDPSQLVRTSKEEFCITIGRPIRRKTVHQPRIERGTELKQLWMTYDGEFEGAEEYVFPDLCSDSSYSSELGECEEEETGEAEEIALEEESATDEPPGWIEPDYCAMI